MKILSLLLALLSFSAQAAVFSPVDPSQIPSGEPPRISQPRVDNPNLFRGKTVAILASHGVEESEITFPYEYLTARGAKVEILVPWWTAEGVVASRFLQPSLFVQASGTFREAKEYDLLVLTGGAWNAQVVRTDGDALALIRKHHGEGRPIAAICAGTSILVNAGLSRGLEMTGSPVVRLDLENSGANFVDEAVVIDRKIVTSRTPDDLPAFVDGIRRVLR